MKDGTESRRDAVAMMATRIFVEAAKDRGDQDIDQVVNKEDIDYAADVALELMKAVERKIEKERIAFLESEIRKEGRLTETPL